MPELTLARFILEFSLMNYDTIGLSDSKMALRMNHKTGWNKTLEYYSGMRRHFTIERHDSIYQFLFSLLQATNSPNSNRL